MIPDFIPVIGLIDDLIILPLLVMLTVKFIPSNIYEECKIEAEAISKSTLPKNKLVRAIILLLWLTIGGLLIHKLWR